VLGDEVYQLTDQSNVGFFCDRATFEPKRTFRYPTQGWGLTTDGTRLIMSNGSAALVGIWARVPSAKPGMESEGLSNGVSMAPGQTQFTRIPRPAYSMAVARVGLMTPALAAL
jgi:hypothetical protein